MYPSVTIVLLAIRDYVRRWGRVPRVLSVDNGPEFRSKELAWVCRILGIDVRRRPPGMPRGGAAIERALGVAEEELIGQMEGNTRQMKGMRSINRVLASPGVVCQRATGVS
jgi:transposase InsO family protein